MNFGENTLHPLQIEDAREAAYRASEVQRGVEDEIRKLSKELANAERRYRRGLANAVLQLTAGDPSREIKPVAVTVARDLARGQQVIADLKHERDVAAGLLEAAHQQAFRRGADRRDLTQLIEWSMRRDLRTDTPPVRDEQPIGGSRT